MHIADLYHPTASLAEKLHVIYSLSRHRTIDLGFRAPYEKLLQAFGNPHLDLPPVIHIAGTNGKGSIAAILRAILECAGYKVHCYTSPHLLRFNERIILAGKIIDDITLESLIDEALMLNGDAPATFFEITTAIAFAAFSLVPGDILILETGLGGRLDCTNIIPKPYVSIINKISYDHREFLGDTLAAIGREKAGIMKMNTPCVLGYQMQGSEKKQLMDMFVDESRDKKAPLFCAGQHWRAEPSRSGMMFEWGTDQKILPRPNLLGDHQIENAGAALAALQCIKDHFDIPDAATFQGLTTVQWAGRMHHISDGELVDMLPPDWEIWYDGGHNDSAGQAIAAQIVQWKAQSPERQTHLILGMKADKDKAEFLAPLLPHISSITMTILPDVGNENYSKENNDIKNLVANHAIPFLGLYPDITNCIQPILNQSSEKSGRILIAGSLYLASKIPGFFVT
jgi:dihydrofolate synthase/folylpolyglutamate synthase